MTHDRFRVLIVCTGNICRSPMAQAMLVHRMRELAGDAASIVEVTSAGTFGLVGEPMEPDAVTALGELGIVAGEFAGREHRNVTETAYMKRPEKPEKMRCSRNSGQFRCYNF